MLTSQRKRQFALYSGAVGVLAAPLAVGAAYGRYQARRDLVRHPLQGDLIDIGGYKLHVRTMGLDNPGPVVLFEAGLSCPHDAWAWIQPEIARSSPTISYDRAGLGGSDAGPKPRTAATMIDELDRLLEALGVRGQVVLVAHSFGGLLATAFAQRHPERVAGIVLADVAHPDQLTRSRRQRAGMPVMWAQMQQAATVARLGLNRLSGSYMLTGIQSLPEADFDRALARVLTSKACQTGCDELDGWMKSVNDEVRGATLPAGVPLTVLTAGKVAEGDPVHREMQQELAALSTNSSWQCVDEADHLGLIMDETYARYVTKAVHEVLAAARTNSAI